MWNFDCTATVFDSLGLLGAALIIFAYFLLPWYRFAILELNCAVVARPGRGGAVTCSFLPLAVPCPRSKRRFL